MFNILPTLKGFCLFDNSPGNFSRERYFTQWYNDSIKINLENTVTIGGRAIPPLVMGFALIILCIPLWGYLEFEGQNKLIGALVALLMAWGVAQLSVLDLGDGVGEKPGSSPADNS